MATENEGVKTETAPPAASNDVKEKPSFESFEKTLIDSFMQDSSTEEEEKSGSKKEPDKEIEQDKEVKPDETKNEEDKPEGEPEEEQTEDNDETKPQEDEPEDKKDEKSEESKTEQTIPYARFKEVNDKVQAYEGMAKAHESVVKFCQDNQIAPEQYRDGLQVLALINTKPEEAITRLESIITDLKVSTGKGLPADLQKEVDEGVLPMNRAKELAEARVKASKSEGANRFNQMQQQQAQQKELFDALSAWSSSKQKLNPDFKPSTDATKPGLFEDFLEKQAYLWTVETPQNITQAVALADKAYQQVLDRVQRYQPKPKSKKAPPSSGGRHRSSDSDVPKTTEDVMDKVARKYGFG